LKGEIAVGGAGLERPRREGRHLRRLFLDGLVPEVDPAGGREAPRQEASVLSGGDEIPVVASDVRDKSAEPGPLGGRHGGNRRPQQHEQPDSRDHLPTIGAREIGGYANPASPASVSARTGS